MSNRYLLFGGDDYYSRGGFHDFIGAFNTIDDAMLEATRLTGNALEEMYGWWHVFDLELLECVAKSEFQAFGASNALPDMKNLRPNS